MVRQLEAIYEDGVLRPLEPLALMQSQRVTITISDETAADALVDHGSIDEARREVGRLDRIPTIDEVRAALSVIPDSMAEFVMKERGEY
jgi:predicted DNA-binding antitoxin AbrB/MazE fold protein